jgi:transcriptional regulator with XRE-family HTH domain
VNAVDLRKNPTEVADAIISAHAEEVEWLDAFAEALDRRRGGRQLARVLEVWGLSQSEAARVFGVSRQAVSKWLAAGPPAERAEVIADLAAASDVLVHHLRRDRIPAVVRRKAARLGDRSLVELLRSGNSGDVLTSCRAMFDVTAV